MSVIYFFLLTKIDWEWKGIKRNLGVNGWNGLKDFWNLSVDGTDRLICQETEGKWDSGVFVKFENHGYSVCWECAESLRPIN